MKDFLTVAETFYSIQGEGSTTGCPSVFLRLAACNLLCQSSTWVCDTIEVWRKGVSTPFANVLSQEYIDHLKAGAHLVVTGGEPLLQHARLVEYLQWLKSYHKITSTIEVETNGTLTPPPLLWALVDKWNVSFKLCNSGMHWSRRVNEDALQRFSSSFTTSFKIVVASEEDVLELVNDFDGLIDFKKVTLMPAGDTDEKLEDVRTLVIELCKKYHFRYSDRLHIVAWNKKTGV